MSEWTYFKEINKTTRDAAGVEDALHVWAPGPPPAALHEASGLYEFDICLAAPLYTREHAGILGASFECPILLHGEEHHLLALVNVQLSKFRQTRGTLYTYTDTSLRGEEVQPSVSLMRWPSHTLRNMKTAYLPRESSPRPNGTIRRHHVPPFSPRPFFVGIYRTLSDVPSLRAALM